MKHNLREVPLFELIAEVLRRWDLTDEKNKITVRALRALRNAALWELDKRYPAILD